MRARDLGELVLLAALWGASFLFMRVAAPEFGVAALVAVRVALAALVLLPLVTARRQWTSLRQYWRPVVFVGVLNSALPFVAFSYAALHITAGLSSVFNATAPLWGALVAWLWLHERLTASRVLGLFVGFAGVAWLAWDEAGIKDGGAPGDAGLAIAACLAATLCYGFSANFTRHRLAAVPPMALAAGTQLAAALALAPLAWWNWPAATPSLRAWSSAAALGLLCSALAYLLYFRLIAQVGAARAISVTFLIPLFGVLWGVAFLDETITPVMAAAALVILLGTALSTGAIGASVPWPRAPGEGAPH